MICRYLYYYPSGYREENWSAEKLEPVSERLSASEPVYFILTEINKQNLHEVIATIKFQRGQLTQYFDFICQKYKSMFKISKGYFSANTQSEKRVTHTQ